MPYLVGTMYYICSKSDVSKHLLIYEICLFALSGKSACLAKWQTGFMNQIHVLDKISKRDFD